MTCKTCVNIAETCDQAVFQFLTPVFINTAIPPVLEYASERVPSPSHCLVDSGPMSSSIARVTHRVFDASLNGGV